MSPKTKKFHDLTAPLYALARRVLRPAEREELTAEVQLLG